MGQERSFSQGRVTEGWSPSTPPEVDFDRLVREHSAVVIHFWAVWDRIDRMMDQSIQAIRPRFDRAKFVSCDVDRPENVKFCRRVGVVSIPVLHCFVNGRQRQPIMGYLAPDALEEEVRLRLDEKDRPKRWWQSWS